MQLWLWSEAPCLFASNFGVDAYGPTPAHGPARENVCYRYHRWRGKKSQIPPDLV
jgi:hypothetical protein